MEENKQGGEKEEESESEESCSENESCWEENTTDTQIKKSTDPDKLRQRLLVAKPSSSKPFVKPKNPVKRQVGNRSASNTAAKKAAIVEVKKQILEKAIFLLTLPDVGKNERPFSISMQF